MSKTEASDGDDVVITFRVGDAETRRRIRMRAAQRGEETMSAYMRSLVDDDLEDADLPLEE